MYLSTPDVYAYKIKSILAHFPATEVSNPNLKVLKLIIGKSVK